MLLFLKSIIKFRALKSIRGEELLEAESVFCDSPSSGSSMADPAWSKSNPEYVNKAGNMQH